jgi:hypothetical protein
MIKTKFFSEDRKFRYDIENKRWRDYSEIVARRNDAKIENYVIDIKHKDDVRLEQNKAEVERLKRLRMSKFEDTIFDSLVEEFMGKKLSLFEMMNELDCEDSKIDQAKIRLAQKELKVKMESMKKSGELNLN